MVVQVILNSNNLSTDRIYDYAVPENIESDIKIGMRVKVPFGRSDKTCEAYVFNILDQSEFNKLKYVDGIINIIQYFDEEHKELIEFMKHRYFCSYISAIRCLTPPGVVAKFDEYVELAYDSAYEDAREKYTHSGTADKILSYLHSYGCVSVESLKAEVGCNNFRQILNKLKSSGYLRIVVKESEKIKDSIRTFVELSIDRSEAFSVIDAIQKKAPARARVLEILCDNYDVELSELLIYAQTSKATVDSLEKKGMISYKKIVCNDSLITYDTQVSKNKPELNTRQEDVVSKISECMSNNSHKVFLLHGVTGSGKTEVYLSLMEYAIKKNLESVMLVPEISLTPQMISQIYSRFGDNVAVLHSKLTVKQRYVEWQRIKNGDVKIAVGARSAVFAPFKHLGLIIVDEEHETTYKSEMSPRYNAVEIARFIAKKNNAVLLLASATPAIDDYYKAENGIYQLLEMPARINNSQLPDVEIVDMRSELEAGNVSIFSNKLKDAISDALSKKEQIILFLNRRGFSGFVSCRSCGYVEKCPNCNISLTYHKSVGKMVCHYCDYKTSTPSTCPNCSGKHIRFFGVGTEKIVEELYKYFPGISVLRMDADTTNGRLGHENILNSFKNGKADILVGTQMITKGLDFANVTLVGVIAADMSLNVDDFRANERTFDLITQVIGRAGRSSKKGLAIVQTYNPDDETLILSAKQDYKSFYKDEILIRQMLMYPPFTEFIKFQFSGSNNNETMNFANDFCEEVKACMTEQSYNGEVYKVSKAPIFIINNKFRYRFLIKTSYKKSFYEDLHRIYEKYIIKKNDVIISVDVNPIGSN